MNRGLFAPERRDLCEASQVVETWWDQRISRARLLADRVPAAADILRFYGRLAEFQRALPGGPAASGRDVDGAVAALPAFLDWLRREAPSALAAAAADLSELGDDHWRRRFEAALDERPAEETSAPAAEAFVVEVIAQPFLERRARARPAAARPGRIDGRCPACGDRPVAGVLREEGRGARRALVCGRCATEWSFPRVSCPGCGEQQFDVLPVYTAEPFSHVRIEACDRCRRYLKTIDLTKDGLAVPQVDDLASLPLDIWAREHGYVRLRDNLLRT